MRKALLWKDYRIFRDVFVGGLVLIAASYALALMVLVMNGELAWSTLLGGGASLTRFFAILVGALFGGYAFAFEREERSNLFLSVLPIPRRAQLQSKLLLAILALALYWAISMAILVVALAFMGVTAEGIMMSMRSMLDFVAPSILVFGLAWRISASARSPLTAAFSGLMALFPVCIAQAAATQMFALEPFYFFSGVSLFAMALAGVIGVILGCRNFLRNDPPAPNLVFFTPMWFRQKTVWSARAVTYHKAVPLTALLWKDYQLVKIPFWIGTGVIVLPHVWSVINWLAGSGGISAGGCLLSIALCSLVFPFWAGQLMGTEGLTRATEFLNPLPISRLHAMTSKCLILVALPVLISLLNVSLLVYANNSGAGATVLSSQMTWAEWYKPAELTTGLALGNGAFVALGAACLLAACGRGALVPIILGMLASPALVTVWASLSTLSSELGEGIVMPLDFVLIFTAAVLGLVMVLVAVGGSLSVRMARC